MTRCTGRCDGSCNGTRPLFGDCRAVGIENAGPEEGARPFGAGPPLRLTLDFETGLFELWVGLDPLIKISSPASSIPIAPETTRMKKANVQEFTLRAAGEENMPGAGACHDRAVLSVPLCSQIFSARFLMLSVMTPTACIWLMSL